MRNFQYYCPEWVCLSHRVSHMVLWNPHNKLMFLKRISLWLGRNILALSKVMAIQGWRQPIIIRLQGILRFRAKEAMVLCHLEAAMDLYLRAMLHRSHQDMGLCLHKVAMAHLNQSIHSQLHHILLALPTLAEATQVHFRLRRSRLEITILHHLPNNHMVFHKHTRPKLRIPLPAVIWTNQPQVIPTQLLPDIKLTATVQN